MQVETTKFFRKTDFDMREIKKEEAGYVPLSKFYTFLSRGTGAYPIQELRANGIGCEKGDKGCAEQARGKVEMEIPSRGKRKTPAIIFMFIASVSRVIVYNPTELALFPNIIQTVYYSATKSTVIAINPLQKVYLSVFIW